MIFLIFAATAVQAEAGPDFQPESPLGTDPIGEFISDEKARLHLARLLATDEHAMAQALVQYHILKAKLPENREVRLELAKLLIKTGNFQDVIRELRFFQDVSPRDRKLADLLLVRAFFEMGNESKALELILSLESLFPDDPLVLESLARSWALLGNKEKAEGLLNKMLAPNRANTDAFVKAAEIHTLMGHAIKARSCLEKAVKTAPNPEAVRFSLAQNLALWGDFRGAEAIYRGHINKHPEDKAVRLKLADILIASQRYSEAETIYRVLLIEQFTAMPLDLALARLHFEAKNDDFAINRIKRILDPDPVVRNPVLKILPNSRGLYIKVVLPGLISRITGLATTSNGRLVLNVEGDFSKSADQTLSVGQVGVGRIFLEKTGDIARLTIDGKCANSPHPFSVYGDECLHLVLPACFSEEGFNGDKTEFFMDPRELIDTLSGAFALKARLLARQGEFGRAADIQHLLLTFAENRLRSVEIHLALGRLFLKAGKPDRAAPCFALAAEKSPKSIEARFYHMGPAKASRKFPDELIQTKGMSPMALVRWGRLFVENNRYREAAFCFKSALEKDPDCFPARLSLAETLAVDQKYNEAIREFEILENTWPGNWKVGVSHARALAWAGQYDRAMDRYEEMRKADPGDPVVTMEKARVAAWAKKMDTAARLYTFLCRPTVDERLALALEKSDSNGSFPDGKAAVEKAGKKTGYGTYEQLLARLSNTAVPSNVRSRNLKLILARLWGGYQIQKQAVLESRAKASLWNRRFPGALKTYTELLETRPGNQEALFDQARVQCVLGLRDCEAATYQSLLRLEPRHTMANNALERLKLSGRPLASGGFSFWDEKGRGDLSKMERLLSETGIHLPLFDRHQISAKGLSWKEQPGNNGETISAIGHEIGYSLVLSPHITASAHWRRKYYSDDLGRTDTGSLRFTWRTDSGGILTAGFDRMDEIYNSYGLKQKIQSTVPGLTALYPINHYWNLDGDLKFKQYSDHNQGVEAGMGLGRLVWDHPRQLKAEVTLRYRDTDEKSIFHYENGILTDITHPYWTPEEHGTMAAGLKWRHDLSPEYVCGAKQHFYQVGASVGAETEGNTFFKIRGQWRYDMTDRISVDLNTLIHRSGQWDAFGVWAGAQYRF